MDILLTALPVVATIAVPLLGLLATPAGLPLLAWLVGNPIGRVVAVIGISIALVVVVYRVGQKDGRDRVLAQQTKANLEALQDRIQVDESIRQMTPDQRREELRKWVR